MKTCSQCGQSKDLECFYREVKMPDGYRKSCKDCKDKRTARWREENREKYNRDMRAYNKRHYSRIRLQRYDLVPEQYKKMLTEQNNACAICLKKPKTLRPLNIDHDHKTGKTRGLLCHGCNRLMVLLDNAELFNRAKSYFDKYA